MHFASIWLNILKLLSAENFFFVENIYFAAPSTLLLVGSRTVCALSPHKGYQWAAALSKIFVI
jgi:hypothetical protein